MKKKLIILPVAATMLLVGIFTTGAVIAQENGTAGTSFASRVATLLGGGLTETQVQSAMDQAHKDMQDEAMQSRLDALKTRLDAKVANGQMTQEQADAYLAQADAYYQWYLTRPQGIQGFGGPGMGFGFEGHGWGHGRGHGMRGPQGMFGAPRDMAPSQGSPSPRNGGTSF